MEFLVIKDSRDQQSKNKLKKKGEKLKFEFTTTSTKSFHPMSTKLISAILSKMSGMNKWRRDFFIHAVHLFLSMRGRHNFENMARYGQYNESSYRQGFAKPFDFGLFNRELISQSCGIERIAAFDPSYITKSGKHTPGVGWHWSGSAGKAKWGLEIGGLAVIDIASYTAMHLQAVQTPSSSKLKEQGQNLIDHYAQTVSAEKVHLQELGIKYLAVDAYFAKRTFVDQVLQNSHLQVITRLRDDAVLKYRYTGAVKKGRGRPKEFAGRVNVKQPSEEHFQLCCQEPDWKLYEGVVYCKAFKRWIKIALWHEIKPDGNVGKVKIYASTDPDLAATDIYLYYKGRFQIEFLYRDAKGHTGLEHCQSRNEERMDFHFNLALTAVNVAKAACWYPNNKNKGTDKGTPFSIEDIKTQFFNELVIDRFFYAFGNDADSLKNHPAILIFRNFGVKAAA